MEQEKAKDIIDLYQDWLTAWNSRNADAMGALFLETGTLIGFDGSQIGSRAELVETLGTIFAHHATAAYVAIVREIRLFAPGVAWLKADAGMVPANATDINPAFNAVQTLIAVHVEDKWMVSVFQNTPAAFHASPELAEKMTNELRDVLAGSN